ncbi:MAG: Spy/CpxP family protein refolding chaperone [Silvibacterium sp.]|nr:Spy/CpxP family protein refolding chaperone [Silvibacterium sp.]MBV8437124.1 Spy/CpxP family protein refolding chaperone [Silvibacterium sp.]
MSHNNFNRPALILSLASLLSLAPALAQDWHGSAGGPPGPPPMERAFRAGAPGRWWDNSDIAQQVGITDDQKKKMDDIFQQNKLRLIDLKAALEKQEAIMQPLIEADQPDEAKILSQIDAIAQARAELEKAHARMLLGIRTVLTPDQWKKFRALAHTRMESRGKWGGPRGEDRGPAGPDGGAPPAPPQNQ